MANELLSVPVALTTSVAAAAGLGYVCRKATKIITSENLALMGLLGAFVFAGQMVNFQLPLMPGTSGHLVGAVLLAIALGPYLAAIALSSVIIIQCLIFQDGGLLALGCNIINMSLVPCFLGYYIYNLIIGKNPQTARIYTASIITAIVAILAGASLVPIEAAISGVLVVPFKTFFITMMGVHLLVGIVEGIITAAVLIYLTQTRPDLTIINCNCKPRISKAIFYSLAIIIIIATAAGLSLMASENPDGLEWSYLERPNQPGFAPMIENENKIISSVDKFQSRYTLAPDYSKRQAAIGTIAGSESIEASQVSAGWTSFAGVAGSALTMFLIWLIAVVLRRKPQAV